MFRPHSPEWYDRLATLQDGYYFPWKSKVAAQNGEDAYLELVQQYLTPEKDLLDVGCGHGEVALELSSHCRSILAYDRVESYIQIARENAQKEKTANIEYICVDSSADKNSDSPRIPAEPNSFDLMISRRGPLHWLADARRVARPGAVLIQLNPLETPLPQWADQVPEPLRSATGIKYQFGMLNSVNHNLALGGLELHSAWAYNVPEFFNDPRELYKRLVWGYTPDEVPSWEDIRPIIQRIFAEFSWSEGLPLRHTRLLWLAVVPGDL